MSPPNTSTAIAAHKQLICPCATLLSQHYAASLYATLGGDGMPLCSACGCQKDQHKQLGVTREELERVEKLAMQAMAEATHFINYAAALTTALEVARVLSHGEIEAVVTEAARLTAHMREGL